MRRVARFLLLLVGVFLAVTFGRMAFFTSKQVPLGEVSPVKVDLQAAIQRLSRALQFQTISFQDTKKMQPAAFSGLLQHIEKSFPLVHKHLKREVLGGYSLLYTWGGKSKGKPCLFLAHNDVVPIEKGTESVWKMPPFGGIVKDGYLWGRGALDDKGSVFGILEAVEWLLGKGFQPQHTVYLGFGHDEEVGGLEGARKIAERLRRRKIRLRFVLDEGLLVIRDILSFVKKPVGLIGIAEKGYVSFALEVDGREGHSSMPPPQTAIGLLSSAIHRLEKAPMPGDLSGPTQMMFEALGPESSLGMRWLMANLWLVRPLLIGQLSKKPSTNATLRTTLAPTIFHAGSKENVLPAHARAVINLRIHPNDTIEKVRKYILATIKEPRIKLKVLRGGVEPSVVSSISSQAFLSIQKSIRQAFAKEKVIVAPSLMVGGTDSLHFRDLADDVYRFTPWFLNARDLDRLHGSNERISLRNYEQAIQFYVRVMQSL
ncbi:MAG: M20/M25/M40 family metallo-hydrolase [Myxococcales bacterium]|nr:M20/M25/M40 family metallo-hydrolase [Myxococcales bacterium]